MLQEKAHLTTIIFELKKENDHLNFKLEGMIKSVCILNFGFENLNEFLGLGKTTRDMKGIGFNYDYLNAKDKFIPTIKKNEFIMSNYKSQYYA